eukprot:jgi/Mesvir1/7723/Mv11669-RA.1
MRNLVITGDRRWRICMSSERMLQEGSSHRRARVVAVCCDTTNGCLYAATDSCSLYAFDPVRGKTLWEMSLAPVADASGATRAPDPSLEGSVGGHSSCSTSAASSTPWAIPIALEYVIEHESVLVAMASGELLLVQPANESTEYVGNVEGGLSAVAGAPDGTKFVLATSRGNLILMTVEWDVLTEVPDALPVRMGAEGDLASHPLPVDASTAFAGDCLRHVSLSFRGDGKYFAAMSELAGGRRQISIWELDACVLHSVVDEMAGLCCPIAWKPSGGVIAGARVLLPEDSRKPGEPDATAAAPVKKLPRKAGAKVTTNDSATEAAAAAGREPETWAGAGVGVQSSVVLFERNGLYRSEFDLCPWPVSGDKSPGTAQEAGQPGDPHNAGDGDGGGGGSGGGGWWPYPLQMEWSPDSELLAVVVEYRRRQDDGACGDRAGGGVNGNSGGPDGRSGQLVGGGGRQRQPQGPGRKRHRQQY